MDWIRDTAIRNLYSTVVTVRENGTKAFAEDGNPVVLDEGQVSTEMARLQAEYDSQDYARKRKAEYDQLNQYEMQFDDQRDGTTTWVDAINAIKAKYPKP